MTAAKLTKAENARSKGSALTVLAAIVFGWTALRVTVVSWPLGLASDNRANETSLTSSRPLQEGESGNSAQSISASRDTDRYLPVDEMAYRQGFVGSQRPSTPVVNALLNPFGDRPDLSHPVQGVSVEDHSDFLNAPAIDLRRISGSESVTVYWTEPAENEAGVAIESLGAFQPVDARASAREFHASSALSRWSIDAWALWREGGNVPLVAGQSSYGRSQAGAVVRYRLGEASGHVPQLYLRGTSALEGVREREVAFGGSARPMPSLPLRVAMEARLSETESGTELRAAGYAVTELPPANLPGGVQGEAYAQAGYVTGDFATPFVDGQARITRPVQLDDDFRLEAGAGVWGGAQDDAARLDMGPTVGVTFRIGPARGRVSADYRFRIAGDAEPASGPALTLTAGF